MDRVAGSLIRTAASHGHLPTARWADPACAQGDRGRTKAAEDLRGVGDFGLSGRSQENGLLSRIARDVVPLDENYPHNLLE